MGLSAEQLLAIADEYCDFHGCHITSFGFLAACAAVPGSRFHGVPVFDSVDAAAEALSSSLLCSHRCRLATRASPWSPRKCIGAGRDKRDKSKNSHYRCLGV